MATATSSKSTESKASSTRAASSVGPHSVREENAEKGFQASAQLIGDLQRVLIDLIELHLQGKQAHWNVVGKNFRDLHLQLDEIIDAAREFSDDVAERLRALHASPDGRTATVVKETSLPPYPNGEIDTAETVDLITARLDAAVATVREVHDEVDDEDPTSADLLHAIIAGLEKFSWMVSAENRTPSA
ncbi:Dps family protein [Gryllotalpicola reticulitermitis]|uniref:Dps family protein n=1 Tax=Gryllotalpicola reticulitermitis TaxID=1184153 RepID=A0ABV8Q2S1_9MICO